jgi:hypothetical protein
MVTLQFLSNSDVESTYTTIITPLTEDDANLAGNNLPMGGGTMDVL